MTFELVKELCECKGVSGREAALREIIKNKLSFCKCETDALGNLLVTLCEPQDGAPSLLFEAHMDRIGLMVTGFDEEGFVKVTKSGGIDPYCLMGSQLEIESGEGFISAAVCAPFPYPAKPHNSAPFSEFKLPEIDALLVDTGLDEPQKSIKVGAAAYIKAGAFELLDSRLAAPALDDRAACAALIETALILNESPCKNGVKLLFSTREETSGKGALAGAFSVEADYCVAVDAGFAISSDVAKKDASEMGKGPEIGISAALDEQLTQLIIDTAEKSDIPCQPLVLSASSTGTDADFLSVASFGRRTALISFPVRYMHHTHETADLKDIEKVSKLLAAVAREAK